MTEREREDESGRYTGTFADGDFLNAIRDVGGSASTAEVADAVGCDRRTAYVRLNGLEDTGDVESRMVGNSLLWSLVGR